MFYGNSAYSRLFLNFQLWRFAFLPIQRVFNKASGAQLAREAFVRYNRVEFLLNRIFESHSF